MTKPLYFEKNLFLLLAQGHEKALDELVNIYYKVVSRVLSQYSQDPEQVKDWVQEVFIMVWEKRTSFEHYDIQNGKAYFIVLARNYALREVSRKRQLQYQDTPVQEPASTVAGPEDYLLHEELETAYSRAIEKLPNRIREVYQYHREEGLSYFKISEKLSISVKTVESQISRALTLLRHELTNYR
ncbi:MAG: sigma-70 family RNA polymerase sigma factor [Siphonobacter sp.]